MQKINQTPSAVGQSATLQSAVKEIIACVAEETKTFRKKTMRQPSEEVYAKAYIIRLVEEMSTLICDYPEECMGNADVVAVLDELTSYTGFFPAFIDWAVTQGRADVSNLEKCAKTLCEFCDRS
jgi:hypothetical protein